MRSLMQRTTARSMVFSSSRTFPGQLWSIRILIASGVISFTRRLFSSAYFSRKCAVRSGMSSRRRRSGAEHKIEVLPHRLRLADDVRVGVLLGELRLKPLVLAREPPLLQRLVHGEDHFLVLERLRDVVEGAVLHRLDRAVDGGEGGDDDDRQVRVGDADGAQRVDAADAGEHDVEDDEVDVGVGVAVENAQRLFAGRGEDDVEAFAPEHGLEHVAEDFFVVDDENFHQDLGSVTVNSAPAPGSLSTAMSPSDACRIRLVIARPSPVPPCPRFVVTSGSKIRPCSSAGIPLPSSLILIRTCPSFSSTTIQMFPRSGTASRALSKTFVKTCCRS